ncbi:MAG: M20/M25/M40 family metallo-hydrolase [Planctomycetes bacterium]|nr:M20/M25/M40 family metallo-hydrolase [Planctomycetota bacterium]
MARVTVLGLTVCLTPLALAVGCATALEQRFQAHIDYLAADELAGRGVGTPGIELAAEYIANEFAVIGLEPAGEDGTYFQTFEMTLHRTLEPSSRLDLGDGTDLKLGVDFTPLSFSSDEAFAGEVVFCGYGIEAEKLDRDDFVHADIRGRVAMMLRGEPPSFADEAGNATPHAMFRSKVYNAKDRGAVAVLIVNQTPGEEEEDRLIEFNAESPDAYGVPVFQITREMGEAMMARGGLDSLAAVQKRMDAGSYASARLRDVRVEGRAVFKKNAAPTRNVLGLLPGAGSRAEEVVVIGAHYDHLGIRRPLARRFKGGKLVRERLAPQIHNGADDNASGTSGMIEIARMLAEDPPNRSVLFIAFTAEESGLHGSKHYVENPTRSLGETVAMLNLDMIGRAKPGDNSVQVFGAHSGEGLDEILHRAAKSVDLEAFPSNDTGGRSDHASFIRSSIPAMHFFSGQHRDYHQPSDDSDKINARDGARITRMVARMARDIANHESRFAFLKQKSTSPDSPGGTPTYRVVMGLSPSYGEDGKPGMKVDAVSADGPAEVGGMKAGDRIIRIGTKEVANIYDYMAATRKNKAGDTVSVVVLRGDKEITLQVTLSSAS